MTTAWVIGFDLSLKAPGAVALPLDWKPGDWRTAKAWLGKLREPKSQDDLEGQLVRYIAIAEWASMCVAAIPRGAVVHGYVEAYGFHKSNANASRIMESGGKVKTLLYERHGIVLQPVTSSEARKLTLGFNPRKPKFDAKVEVQDAVFNKFKAPTTWGENECDALLVAQFGLSTRGGKIFMLAPPPAAPKKARK
jgi:hypothetical protein